MSGNYEKEDLRIKKTYKALITSMLILLKRQNFKQITVNDICEEALVSRATFYSHFDDKYDLLKHWMDYVISDIIKDVHNFEELQVTVNEFIHKNQRILKNILQDANSEVLDLLRGFMASIIDLFVIKRVSSPKSSNHNTLFNFCVGGLCEMILWQVKNNFPVNHKMIDDYFYNMLAAIMIWDAAQEDMEERQDNI